MKSLMQKMTGKMMLSLSLVVSTSLNTGMDIHAQELSPRYLDTSLSFEERAADLVSRMTLEEKVSQMVTDADAIPRLGVPAYRWWSECLHGIARNGNATVFPMPIGLAATFDDDMVYKIANAISTEGRILYDMAQKRGNFSKYTGLTYYSPSINIYRDPRWGRGQETYGEDPFLTSRMGVAYVKGLQGNDPKYLKVAACAKHYAAYSGYTDAEVRISETTDVDMYQTYLPAFKALVKEADVESVMGAYNLINGEPASGSRKYLVDILRNQWGFKGYVTSDCGALARFVNVFNICKNAKEAAAIAANSGLNLNCGGTYKSGLPGAVKEGLVKESTIDSLLTTLLTTRFKLGLFDNPKDVPYSSLSWDKVDCAEHRALAYQAAAKSFVLLENKNNTLPLNSEDHYVYVTGANANNQDALIGNYFGMNGQLSTFLEGISNKMPKGMSLQYRPGVQLTKEAYNEWTTKEAPEADVVVACLGLTNALEGEGMDAIAADEHGEVPSLSIPEAQLSFLRKIRANIDSGKSKNKTGKKSKLVVVLTGGCPVILKDVRELADALIYAWYPGEEGGNALADMLFGRYSPSGRTPLTFMKSVEQLPPFDDYSMKGRTYRYMDKEAMYPFGYGLSYTTFEYVGLQLPAVVKAGEPATVSVSITNTGKMAADEVVQLYIKDVEASVDVPLRQLCGFKRIHLKPGETQKVTLDIAPENMSVVTGTLKRTIEPGLFRVSIGNGQPLPVTANYVEGEFKVKGKKTLEL